MAGWSVGIRVIGYILPSRGQPIAFHSEMKVSVIVCLVFADRKLTDDGIMIIIINKGTSVGPNSYRVLLGVLTKPINFDV